MALTVDQPTNTISIVGLRLTKKEVSEEPNLEFIMARFASVSVVAFLLSGTAFASDYSTAANERPLTKPAGMTQINATANAVGTKSVGLSVDYGITDTMDVSVGLPSFVLGEGGGLQKAVGVGLGYGLVDGDELDVAAGLNAPLNFEGGDVLPMIGVDADTRYLLMDGALAIRTGHGLLSYSLLEGGGLTIGLNLGLTYQITDAINFDVDTPLMSMADGNTTSIADAQVIDVGFGYNMESIDIGLKTTNVTEDARGVGVIVGYRL